MRVEVNPTRYLPMSRPAVVSVIAALAAATVWAALWLVESVLPNWFAAPWVANRLGLLLVVGVVGGLLQRGGQKVESAVWFATAGVVWLIHDAPALTLCASSTLYRPCATDEILWRIVPGVALLIAAAVGLERKVLVQERPDPSIGTLGNEMGQDD